VARDVEVNLTASDKTGPALEKEAAAFKRTQEKMKRDADKAAKEHDESIRKVLGRFTNLVTAVSPKLAASLAKSFSGAAEAGGPLLLAGIGAAVAVGMPFIGATISAGIIGGAGLGGVIGGLLLASKDARVQAAGKEVGDALQVRLTAAGESFIAPTIEGIDTIKRAIDTIDIEQILGDSSKFVQPLAQGIGDAMESLGDGIEKLIHNAGPVIDSIGHGIADIGDALGDGLSSLADNGDDAASALNILFLTINATIASTFAFVNALTEVYGAINKIGGLGVLGALADDSDDLSGAVKVAGGALAVAAQNADSMGGAALAAGNGVQSLAEHLNEVTAAARDLFGATTSVGEAIDRVTAAAKANGKTLSSNTEKGRANREALGNLAEALQRQYDATVAVTGAGRKADSVAAANRATFIRLATSLTGSASKARALANEILGIPAKKDTKVNANTHDAEARLKALREKLDAVHSKTITVNVAVNAGALNKVRSGKLGPQLNLAADSYWAAIDRSGGDVSRTGGPVQVSNNLDVVVTPDLSGIQAAWRADIRESERGQRHRSQVRYR
jgi:hypothetical protein